MLYLFFVIPMAYVLISMVWYILMDGKDADDVAQSCAITFVLGFLGLCAYAGVSEFYKSWGINGFIAVGYVIGGVSLPITFYLLVKWLIKKGGELAKYMDKLESPKPALLPQGNYVDVTYGEPVHRTVADLMMEK